MLFVSVFFLIMCGMFTASMSIIGAYSFVKVHDWHFITGSVLYAICTFLIFRSVL